MTEPFSKFRLFLFATLRRVTLSLKTFFDHIGLGRFYKSLYESSRKNIYDFLRPRGIIQINAQGLKWLVDGADYVIASDLITYGVWEKEESALMTRTLRPSMTFVDIGANIGYHTLLAARTVGPSGRCYAFEPDPHNYDLLCRNISLNGFQNITPVQKIISDRNAVQKLFRSTRNYGGHSLAAENVNLGVADHVEIESVTLNDFFKSQGSPRIDLIKMDTQGAEGLILAGAGQILSSNPSVILLMEFWPFGLSHLGTDPRALLESLRRQGFRIQMLREGELRPVESMEETMRLAEIKNYLTLFCSRT